MAINQPIISVSNKKASSCGLRYVNTCTHLKVKVSSHWYYLWKNKQIIDQKYNLIVGKCHALWYNIIQCFWSPYLLMPSNKFKVFKGTILVHIDHLMWSLSFNMELSMDAIWCGFSILIKFFPAVTVCPFTAYRSSLSGPSSYQIRSRKCHVYCCCFVHCCWTWPMNVLL